MCTSKSCIRLSSDFENNTIAAAQPSSALHFLTLKAYDDNTKKKSILKFILQDHFFCCIYGVTGHFAIATFQIGIYQLYKWL